VYAFLEGELASLLPDQVVLDVGGVGYRLFVSRITIAALPAVGSRLRLFTRLVVRENDLSLWGFATAEEEQAFLLLTAVNGVGPRLAMTVLSQLTPMALFAAVGRQESARLELVPGIGRKLAERIALDLRDKVPEVSYTVGPIDEAVSALLALGLREGEARSAVEGLTGDTEQILRQALRRLSEAK
jgi:Holliday junction DNA helicase RuvA